jgi:hypothetical protein
MTPRLTAALLVSALVRRTQQAGGNAAILARGGKIGAILVVCLDRGRRSAVLERLLSIDGSYRWQAVGPDSESDETEVASWLDRRRARDPDLWIIELDVPDAQRFVAETTDAH